MFSADPEPQKSHVQCVVATAASGTRSSTTPIPLPVATTPGSTSD